MTRQETQREIAAWFGGRLPKGWFAGDPEVQVDGDEIVVLGALAPPAAEGASAGERVKAFRESSREARMGIAADAERTFNRKVSWGAAVDDERYLFTHLNVPVMTRLRMPERQLLDTLVEAGVARSRSDALGWCVRLVGRHEGDWLQNLRDALVQVQKVRAEGPATA